MDERTMNESRGLVEKIAEIVGMPDLPSNAGRAHFDVIDFQGRDAIKREDYQMALTMKARAAIVYFDNGFYYQAANSADRAANASYSLRLKVEGRKLAMVERVLISTEAYLSELAGNCYLEIGEKENAIFAYLKAAKSYVFDFNDIKKAEELLARAEVLGKDVNTLRKDRFAKKIYDRVSSKIGFLKLAPRS